jgi:hypothetical protein
MFCEHDDIRQISRTAHAVIFVLRRVSEEESLCTVHGLLEPDPRD